MSKIYFLSDVHLGAHSASQERLKQDRLVSFFRKIENEGAELVIGGDLFDFWFEYNHVVPRMHFRVLAQLAALASKITVRYIAGNHDFWLDSFMSNEVGLIIHPDEYIMSLDGKKYFISHGDGLLKQDHGYRMLKWVLRHRVNIILYRLLHPDFGVPFALFCSHLSRKSSGRRKRPYSDSDYREFAFSKIDQGFDYVVLGHTHWAAMQPHNKGFYLNPGFFGRNFTYIVVNDGEAQLCTWNGQSSEPYEPQTPPGNLGKLE